MVIIVVVITITLAFNVAENGWEKILMMVAMIFLLLARKLMMIEVIMIKLLSKVPALMRTRC